MADDINPALLTDFEARSHRLHTEQVSKRLSERTDLSVRDQWAKEAFFDQADWSVVFRTDGEYKFLTAASVFLGEKLTSEMRDILSEVTAINNQFVGMRVSECEVVLSGDVRVRQLSDRLGEWARAYVDLRILRSRQRTENQVQKFERIYGELLPKLEGVAFSEGSLNRCIMSEFTDYLAWLLFEKTCRQLVEIKFDDRKMTAAFRVVSVDARTRAFLQPLVELYRWQHDLDLLNIVRIIARRSSSSDQLDADAIKSRLQLLVADIQEMRPFLIRNFRSENVLEEIAEGVFISWTWAVGRGIGLVQVAESKERMIELQHQNASGVTFTLLYDGLLGEYSAPWINTETILEDGSQALSVNLRILEAIHGALFSLYEKVNVSAIIARFRQVEIESKGNSESDHQQQHLANEPSDEEFAAVCHLIAEPQDDRSSATDTVKAVRVQKLLALLTDRLGCEVRQGKGSEIVIFRPGGHHFRLGHHKRNIYVPTMIIKNILKQIGVTFDEWLAAIS